MAQTLTNYVRNSWSEYFHPQQLDLIHEELISLQSDLQMRTGNNPERRALSINMALVGERKRFKLRKSVGFWMAAVGGGALIADYSLNLGISHYTRQIPDLVKIVMTGAGIVDTMRTFAMKMNVQDYTRELGNYVDVWHLSDPLRERPEE